MLRKRHKLNEYLKSLLHNVIVKHCEGGFFMSYNKGSVEETTASKPLWFCALTSALLGVVFSLAIFIVMAIIMCFAPVGESVMRPFVLTTSIVSCIVSGFLSARQLKRKGAIVGLVAGIIYILILYIICCLTITGFIFDAYVILLLIGGGLSGGIGGILAINIRSKRRRKR